MAKKINLADLVFKVSDDGTLKIFEGKAKKAGDATAKLGKKTDETTYATKKGINATANQTKNFANMARGISGSLVPAYATLAANVFALTAVFGFLKGAADYRLLQEGQTAYASVTGVAYKTLTNTIVEATDAQIKYSDAAQAAAIGTAAGLTPDQLNKLGAAAKTVSIALGRDVTDSFNRLIRGTTKAEPELLDELGIVLRLETATKNYAAALGVSKESLNAFQRTQAVTVDVLDQVETKFAAINAIMDPQTNQINKLNKSFDDLLNTFRMLIAGPAEGLASFFSQNVYAAAGALGLFALPIIQSILPAFDEWEKAATAKLASHDAAVAKSSNRIKAYERLQEMNAAKAKARAQQAGTGLFQLSKGQAAGAAGTGLAQLQAGRTISDSQLRNLKAQATKGIGIFKDMDSKVKASWIKAMKEMNMSTKVNLVDKITVQLKKTELQFRSTAVKIKAAWSTAMAGIQKVSRVTAGVVSKAFGFLTGISIAVLAFEGIKAGMQKFGMLGGQVKYAESELSKLLRTQKDLNKELDKMLDADRQMAEANLALSLSAIVKRQGERLVSANVGVTIQRLNEAQKKIKELQDKGIRTPGQAAAAGLADSETGIIPLTDEMMNPSADSKELQKLLNDYDEGYRNITKRLDTLKESYTDIDFMLTKNADGTISLTKENMQLIDSYIQAGNAVKYLEQSEKSYQQALQGRMGKTSSQRALLLLAQQRAQAFNTKISSPGFATTGTAAEREAARAEATKAGAVASAMETSAAEQRALKIQQDKAALEKQQIINRIEGTTKYAARLQKILEIETKTAQVKALQAEITELEAIFDQATDKVTARENIENKQAQLQLLQGQKTGLQNSINLTRELGVVAVETFENSMIKGIDGVIQGTMSVKDAFKSMAQSILVSLSQVLAKMLAMKVMTAMIPGFAMADGGIIPMAKGGITGYRNGGIATEPTYLVGEGKHNEAVVPLPDGRSIPVNMKGAGGNNNIVINVDAGGNTNSTGGNAEQGKALGMAIQMAVMETIQREKRPGGVLS